MVFTFRKDKTVIYLLTLRIQKSRQEKIPGVNFSLESERIVCIFHYAMYREGWKIAHPNFDIIKPTNVHLMHCFLNCILMMEPVWVVSFLSVVRCSVLDEPLVWERHHNLREKLQKSPAEGNKVQKSKLSQSLFSVFQLFLRCPWRLPLTQVCTFGTSIKVMINLLA